MDSETRKTLSLEPQRSSDMPSAGALLADPVQLQKRVKKRRLEMEDIVILSANKVL